MSTLSLQTGLGDLSSNVSFLGSVLGNVLKEQGGNELFQAVEELRLACKNLRSSDSEIHRSAVHERVEGLNPGRALQVVRAFTLYFHLINMAEESHRLRRIAEKEIEQYPSPRPGSISESLTRLRDSGASLHEVEELIRNLSFRPVFTAHPTEARRMSLLRHLRQASRLVDGLNAEGITPRQREYLTESLYSEVTNLWQTNELRAREQTVMDEVRNGLYYFDEVVFDVVARIYGDLSDALEETYPSLTEDLPTFLTFGSWIGGDRDGNPNVAPQMTENTLHMHRAVILSKYIVLVHRLMGSLTASTVLVRASDSLMRSVRRDEDFFGEAGQNVKREFPTELYRQKLSFMLRRLQGAASRNAVGWPDGAPVEKSDYESKAYLEAEEFLADLRILIESLDENHGSRISRVHLQPLLWQVKTFGFHLCTLDIRQHRDRHLAAIDEIFEASGFCPDFSSLPETERSRLLSIAIERHVSLANLESLSKPTRETLEVFQVVERAHAEMDSRAVDTYIVSFTQEASDLLAVLFLAGSVGLFDSAGGTSSLQVVPLFETERDLECAPDVMRDLYRNSVYRRHLQAWQNRQEIMIGYSDSAKDAGFLTSSWALYTAQKKLSQQADDLGIEVIFFHGRGGAIGRGGGPLYRAILAQPEGTIRGKTKVTEQGEVLYTRYGNPGIAHRHLEQVLNAILTMSSSRVQTPPEDLQRFEMRFQNLSVGAGSAYRELVSSDSEFIQFLEEGTPLRSITRLRMASRPAKRGNDDLRLDDLRAIPWVFAWIQSRYGLPGWYGVGTALIRSIDEGNLDELRRMYQNWQPFKWLIDSSQISLGKADMAIAGRYSELVSNPEVRDRYRGFLVEEVKRTVDTINQVARQRELLDGSPVLQRSIELRNPYVDPMSYIQIEAIGRLRGEKTEESIDLLRSVIDRSVTGIAAGLQNTG